MLSSAIFQHFAALRGQTSVQPRKNGGKSRHCSPGCNFVELGFGQINCHWKNWIWVIGTGQYHVITSKKQWNWDLGKIKGWKMEFDKNLASDL